MSDETITIVIPVYDTEPAELSTSVASALAQTDPRVEIVVVDDGSTRPDTLEVLGGLRGIQLVRQPNQGVGAALNTGIRASTGGLLLVLGSDDWIEPDVATRLRQALEGDVRIAYPRVEMFGAASGSNFARSEYRAADLALYNGVVATALVRRADWLSAGGFDERRDCAEDWVLWATVLGRTGGRAVRVDDAVLHYRQHTTSLNTVNSSRQALATARRRIAEALPHLCVDLYVSAAGQADEMAAELRVLHADAARWQRVRPVLGPALAARRRLRSRLGSRVLPPDTGERD